MRSPLLILLPLLIGLFIVGWMWIARNPRDSTLRRSAKQAVLLIALLAVGLSVGSYLARNSALDRPVKPLTRSQRSTARYYVKRIAVEDEVLFRDLGMEVARFEFNAPPDAKVMFWIETYVNGELAPGLSWGSYRIPQPGERIEDRGRFTRFRPPGATGEERVRWAFGFDNSSSARWVDDPLASFAEHASGGGKRSWRLDWNRNYTIWEARGGDEDQARVTIKCRIEKADPDREDRPSSGTIPVPPPNGPVRD